MNGETDSAPGPVHRPVGRLSRIIRERRELLELTQSDLAELLGISAATVSHLETARREPSLEVLERLASVLKCRVGDFFDESPQPAMTICYHCGGQGCVTVDARGQMIKDSCDLMMFRERESSPKADDPGAGKPAMKDET